MRFDLRLQQAQARVERVAFVLAALQGECQRLVSVANDFLRFARLKDLKLVPEELGRLVGELTDFFEPTAKAAHIDVKTYVPSDLPQVALDRDLFKQALLNLLLNAQQAMPQGGEITLQASVENADPACVCLSVIDTGPGIRPEDQEQIFGAFYQAGAATTGTAQGAGLGLAIVQRFAALLDARLKVSSKIGQGSLFEVSVSGSHVRVSYVPEPGSTLLLAGLGAMALRRRRRVSRR